MRRNLLILIPQFAWITVALSGCGDSSGSQSPRSPTEAIRECVRNSDTKLDEALAEDTVVATAREIVQLLDDYEDTKEMKPFIQFHRGVEMLEQMATRGDSHEDLKSVIEKLKELASQLLSQKPT